MNLRPQCYNCNINKSGNWVAFEQRLTNCHGIEYVIWLKKENEETKGQQFDSLWYLAKIAEYDSILKTL